MIEAGVPVVPEAREVAYTAEDGLLLAKEIGFPVMIKASPAAAERECICSEDDFNRVLQCCPVEFVKGFSDDTMYIENILKSPAMWNSDYGR